MLAINDQEKRKIKDFLEEFKTGKGEKYEVLPEGSLGLLALGDLGLIAWRCQRSLAGTAERPIRMIE